MISYAQNFEDVILERIFKNKKSGFYVDVGACHPVYDSVTYHFYLKGWSGINIEPQPKLFLELEAMRERDTNLRVCVGAQPGRETLYVTRNVGTSTLNQSLAENYRRDLNIDEELTVELVTLDQIWSDCVGDQQVDFMKIDVEGFEKDVLSGADFSRVAPSILVIEATLPNSQELCYGQWEALILEYYEFFYFDGLNRFYYRKGYPLNKATFCIPPNVFDYFKVFPQVLLEQANESLLIENQDLKKQFQASLVQLTRKDEALNHAGNAYTDLQLEDRNLHQQLELATGVVSGYQSEVIKAQQAYESLLAAYSLKERALAEASSAHEALLVQFQAKQDELRRLQGHLNDKDAALQHATTAYQAIQSELNKHHGLLESLQYLLQEKDTALLDANCAYESLQAKCSLAQQEITNIEELLLTTQKSYAQADVAYTSLHIEFEHKLSELATLETILQVKESAIHEAGVAYEALKAAFDDAQASALHASELFQSSTRSLEEATTAYEALKTQLEEKLSELGRTQHILAQKESSLQESVSAFAALHQILAGTQAQLGECDGRQKEADQALSEAAVYCESLATQLQRKDDALADAAQAYQTLKEEFDDKIRELGELHDRLSKQTQLKTSNHLPTI